MADSEITRIRNLRQRLADVEARLKAQVQLAPGVERDRLVSQLTDTAAQIRILIRQAEEKAGAPSVTADGTLGWYPLEVE